MKKMNNEEKVYSYSAQLGMIMHLGIRLDFLKWFKEFLETHPWIDITTEKHTLHGWKEFFNQHDYSITRQTLRKLGIGDEEVKRITKRRKYTITKRYEDGTTEKRKGYDIQFGETPFKEHRATYCNYGNRGYYNIIPFLIFETNKDAYERCSPEDSKIYEGCSEMYFKINPNFIKTLESGIKNYTDKIAECKANLKKAKIQSIEKEIEGLQRYLDLLLSDAEYKEYKK